MIANSSDGQGSPATGNDWRKSFIHFMRGRSLADCVDSGRDNILQLRLLAALMVVLGHSYVVVGRNSPVVDPIHRILPATYTHLIGVMMFFMISGFLITLSYVRRPQFLRFLRARALRIWPALVTCVVIWAFVLGPMLSDVPLLDYFTKRDRVGTPYAYFLGNASIFRARSFLPGLFATNPLPYYVNVSLWTIPIETTMYLWVAGAGLLRLFRLPWLTSIAIAALFSVLILWPMIIGQLPYRGVMWLGLVLQGFFGAGAIACLLRCHVPISTGLMLALGVACLLASKSTHATPFMWLAVGYFVLWFAYVPRLPAIPYRLDLSYGTYLWAFPVQQSVIHFTGVQNPHGLFAIVTPIVLAIAAASWLFVEKPALRLKEWRWRRPPALQPA